MVEVRIIPEGVSGIKKSGKTSSKPRQRKEAANTISCKKSQTYHQAAKGAVSRMKKDNQAENKRITEKQMRALIRKNILLSGAKLTSAEIDNMVNEKLPTIWEAYRGAEPVKTPQRQPSAEERAVWDARRAERRRQVRANRVHRKADQPLSHATRDWIMSGNGFTK